MRRTLYLKREALTEITGADLTRVAAAYAPGPTSPLKECVGELSLDTSCLQTCHFSCWSCYTEWR